MALTFNSFDSWKAACDNKNIKLYQAVIDFEISQRDINEDQIWSGLEEAYQVMKEAVHSGLHEDMKSVSGMIDNGAKKVLNSEKTVLSTDFKKLIARALAAKEVNSCMGRVVAAPTAGASGILPGTLLTLQEIHQIDDRKIHEALLIGAGVALILEKRASIAGAVGGCQAETGAAAAMAAAGITYCLGGSVDQIFNAVAITIQCMLGLVCDPVAGLVEIPCVVRNASAAAIANSSAQIALSNVSAVIPVDECVTALGEVGQSMESKYKETAEGGLAATPTGRAISKRVLIEQIEMMDDEV
ncbi:MAG: L-serine ammonia-lyase, iron-sulfur-dependent, subunit alpha [Bacteroidota bacterium]